MTHNRGKGRQNLASYLVVVCVDMSHGGGKGRQKLASYLVAVLI